MSVVQIAKACTLKCTYCFDKVGAESAKSKDSRVTISRDSFHKYLSRMGEFFQGKPEERNICVSGGEPTLHPEFIPFIEGATNTGYLIYLLSNFTFNEKIRNYLIDPIKSGKISTMVNVNSPTGKYAGMTDPLWLKTMMNLTALQCENVRLSFNIFDPDEDYEFIFKTLKKLPKVDKMVRIGVVNSIISNLRKDNTWVFDKEIKGDKKESQWSFYQRLGKVTDKLVERLSVLGYKVYLDCGVGWCIFSPKTIELIKKDEGIIHGCSLPNDEVSTDSQYSACYTLYDYGNEDRFLTTENISVKKSRWWFIFKTEFFKEHYLILPKCTKCPLLQKGCPRFCVSNNIQYYEQLFGKNGEFIDTPNLIDTYFSEMTEDVKNFSKLEYCLARGLYTKFEKLILQLEQEKGLSQDLVNSNYSIRYYLYNLLYLYISEKIDKKTALEMMSSICTQYKSVDTKDEKLAKIVTILIKEYKFLKPVDQHNTHNKY